MGIGIATLGLIGGWTGAATSAAAAGVGAWSAYETGKENAANIREQAEISANQTRRQAEEQKKAMEAQARGLDRQSLAALMEANERAQGASEELRQGEISQEKANLEQLNGEREAARRSRILAQEIGEQYAQFAGNGFAVDASPTDTFGSIIKTSTAEGQADITTILENANLNKWSYEEEKRAHRRNAASDLASANASVFKARSLSEGAADYRTAAAEQQANAEIAARETLAYGRRAAKAQRKSGIRGAIGGALGAVGSFGKDSNKLLS